MKIIRCIFTIILLLCSLTGEALAMNTGFDTEPLPPEKRDEILGRLHHYVLTAEPQRKAIRCFDVNDQGWIAVGSEAGEDKIVCVYSNSGDYLYGYRFNTSGSFYVEWDGDCLLIYHVRGDLAVSVDSAGEIRDIARIQDTENNTSYWYTLYATRRKAGDTLYVIRNDMGLLNIMASSYSQLVKVDANGEETILYDVNAAQLKKTVVILAIVLAAVAAAIACIVGSFKQAAKGQVSPEDVYVRSLLQKLRRDLGGRK